MWKLWLCGFEPSYKHYSEWWIWNATFLNCAVHHAEEAGQWRVTHIWTSMVGGHQVSAVIENLPFHANVISYQTISMQMECFFKFGSAMTPSSAWGSLHVCFIPFSWWVLAWLIECLLSNANILDAVQVWCAVVNVWSVFSFMEMFKHQLRVPAHLNLFHTLWMVAWWRNWFWGLDRPV